jgi:hypothetical protein
MTPDVDLKRRARYFVSLVVNALTTRNTKSGRWRKRQPPWSRYETQSLASSRLLLLLKAGSILENGWQL